MTVARATADRRLSSTPVLFDDLDEGFGPPSMAARKAVEQLATSDVEDRGAVFTRREVVDFILDLSGYTSDRQLHAMRVLEPSCGEGDFVLPLAERLLCAWEKHGEGNPSELTDSLRAVELHAGSLDVTRRALFELLQAFSIAEGAADELLAIWLVQGDFLLTEFEGTFDFVVGNPPYVRHERVPKPLMSEYRRRYSTIYDRADLYVPFIERSLRMLSDRGRVGIICADRWMKNRYGGPLRSLVAKQYRVEHYVDMVGTPAFHSDVIAYPAITVLGRGSGCTTRVARQPDIEGGDLRALACETVPSQEGRSLWSELDGFVRGADPWLTSGCDGLSVARRLEDELPTIEEAGCRVGIGVATGADRVFIGPYDELDVEPERKLPLATTRDIRNGAVEWRGLGIVNPFDADGCLVDLSEWPRLRAYLEEHSESLRKRHVAKKNPKRWYRTIDKISEPLTHEPKLLIPDIKGDAQIVYEEGGLYPHHNLYFITSSEWDLQALQVVLSSGIAALFVSLYSTRMRGGYLRFQAQYLRRIRLPRWEVVSESFRSGLREVAVTGDAEAGQALTAELYGLDREDWSAIAGTLGGAAT